MVGIIEVVVDFAELPSASAETWVRTWPGETLAVDLVRSLAHLEVAASCILLLCVFVPSCSCSYSARLRLASSCCLIGYFGS